MPEASQELAPRRHEMVDFYRQVIGLEVHRAGEQATFLRIADGIEGHPQVLAIFEADFRSNGPGEPSFEGHDVAASPLHHFGFALEPDDFESELRRLETLGVELRHASYPVLGWRALYLYDPDGNTVEFVRRT